MGNRYGFSMIRKLMDSLGKMDGFPKNDGLPSQNWFQKWSTDMKSGGKIDGSTVAQQVVKMVGNNKWF